MDTPPSAQTSEEEKSKKRGIRFENQPRVGFAMDSKTDENAAAKTFSMSDLPQADAKMPAAASGDLNVMSSELVEGDGGGGKEDNEDASTHASSTGGILQQMRASLDRHSQLTHPSIRSLKRVVGVLLLMPVALVIVGIIAAEVSMSGYATTAQYMLDGGVLLTSFSVSNVAAGPVPWLSFRHTYHCRV